MNFFKSCCLILVAALVICAPLAAQTANPPSITLQYSAGGQNNNGSGSTLITGIEGVLTARISQNFDSNGNPVTAPSPSSAAGVFVFNVTGNSVNVGLDTNTLAVLATKGQNTYNGSLKVSGNNCPDCLNVPISLQIGSNGQIT